MWFLKRTQEEDFTEDTLVNSQEFSYDDETNYAAQSLVNLSDRASQRIKGTIQGEKCQKDYMLHYYQLATRQLVGSRFARKLGVKKKI